MCVFSSSCKDKKKDQMQNINQNVEITDESNFYEIVIEATTIEVFSVSNSDLQTCLSYLEKELQKDSYWKEQKELEFKLVKNIDNKNDIHLKNIRLKLLLLILSQQYNCEFRIDNNEIVFFSDTDHIGD